MAHKIHERRAARESALALLYSGDISEKDVTEIVDDGAYPADDLALSEYAEMLIAGVAEHVDDIDKHLASTSENWSLDRMPVVDRAILRLATFEMIYVDDVPVSVSINEAVELAKMYGGEDDSSRFVNGILGRIARMLEEEAGPATDASQGQNAEGRAVQPDESVEVAEETEKVEEAENAEKADEAEAADDAEGEPSLQADIPENEPASAEGSDAE